MQQELLFRERRYTKIYRYYSWKQWSLNSRNVCAWNQRISLLQEVYGKNYSNGRYYLQIEANYRKVFEFNWGLASWYQFKGLWKSKKKFDGGRSEYSC